MIDSILLILGISNNYTLFAICISGIIVLFFLMEFLFLLSSIFKWIGGY